MTCHHDIRLDVIKELAKAPRHSETAVDVQTGSLFRRSARPITSWPPSRAAPQRSRCSKPPHAGGRRAALAGRTGRAQHWSTSSGSCRRGSVNSSRMPPACCPRRQSAARQNSGAWASRSCGIWRRTRRGFPSCGPKARRISRECCRAVHYLQPTHCPLKAALVEPRFSWSICLRMTPGLAAGGVDKRNGYRSAWLDGSRSLTFTQGPHPVHPCGA